MHKIVFLFLLIFNYNHSFSQQQAKIYLIDGRVLKYDEIVFLHQVRCKNNGSKEFDKYDLSDVYLAEDTDDSKKSSFVHARISYSHKKKLYSYSENWPLTYAIFTDSLIISIQSRGDGRCYYVYDLTDSNSKPLFSQGLVFKKKENEKFRALLLKHFSSCEAAKDIINKYEGDEWIGTQSKVGWDEVLSELQDICPCDLFWNSDKILEQIKKLEKKAG